MQYNTNFSVFELMLEMIKMESNDEDFLAFKDE